MRPLLLRYAAFARDQARTPPRPLHVKTLAIQESTDPGLLYPVVIAGKTAHGGNGNDKNKLEQRGHVVLHQPPTTKRQSRPAAYVPGIPSRKIARPTDSTGKDGRNSALQRRQMRKLAPTYTSRASRLRRGAHQMLPTQPGDPGDS